LVRGASRPSGQKTEEAPQASPFSPKKKGQRRRKRSFPPGLPKRTGKEIKKLRGEAVRGAQSTISTGGRGARETDLHGKRIFRHREKKLRTRKKGRGLKRKREERRGKVQGTLATLQSSIKQRGEVSGEPIHAVQGPRNDFPREKKKRGGKTGTNLPP